MSRRVLIELTEVEAAAVHQALAYHLRASGEAEAKQVFGGRQRVLGCR